MSGRPPKAIPIGSLIWIKARLADL